MTRKIMRRKPKLGSLKASILHHIEKAGERGFWPQSAEWTYACEGMLSDGFIALNQRGFYVLAVAGIEVRASHRAEIMKQWQERMQT